MARNEILTKNKYKEIKQYQTKMGKDNKSVSDKFGYSLATISRIRSSKNYKGYKAKVQAKKPAAEKELEEFLKNPKVDESLEELAAKFVGKQKKAKPTFWQKLKAHFC